MKTFYKTILITATIILTTNIGFADNKKENEKTVVFKATIHCQNCVNKIEKNLPFEKGVKDLKVDIKNQTVSISYKADKNSEAQLKKALEKIKIPVTGTVTAKDIKNNTTEKKCCTSTCKNK